MAAVRSAGRFGLIVDLCVQSHQIAEVTTLAQHCPEATFVLDHFGKPDIATGQWVDWHRDIRGHGGTWTTSAASCPA